MAENRIVRPVSTQVDFIGQIVLFEVWKQPTVDAPGCIGRRSRIDASAWGNAPYGRFVVVHGQAQLAQVVGALKAASCLAGCLNRRQKQTDHHSDDSDHHQQLHQGETTFTQSIQTRGTHADNHAALTSGAQREMMPLS